MHASLPSCARHLTERKLLKVLNPTDLHFTKGGIVPNRSLVGLYQGALVTGGWQQAKIKGVGLQEKGPKIRRKWLPNVQRTTFHSNVLGLDFEMPATVNAVKTVHKWGSFDNYLLNISPSLLSRESTRIRDLIRSVLHARIDAGGLAALPIGITPAMSNGDTVRPLEAVRGDEVIRDHPMPKVIKRGGWRRFDGPLKVDPSRGVSPGR